MKKVKIVTDSNSGILQSEAKELGIYVIPMPFTVNNEEYLEEISMSQEEFFKHLESDADVKTSQPSQYYLENLWNDLLKENDEILYIPMCSGLSATCANAKRYAESFDNKVHVVDNLRISVTQRESVMEAIALAKKGKSAQDIKKYLEETKNKASIYITLGTLKYLKKGGRINPAVATIGTLLKVKPILFTRGDKFNKYAMTMSLAQAKKKMIEKIKEELETEFKDEYAKGKMYLSIAHTQNEAEALKFKDEVLAAIPNVKIHYIAPLSLSVSCHIGSGALALAMAVNNYAQD